MNSWDLGNTVSCSAYLLVMGSWGFRILKCILVMGPWEPWILNCVPNVGPWEPWILKCILDVGSWKPRILKCILDMGPWEPRILKCIFDAGPWEPRILKCILNTCCGTLRIFDLDFFAMTHVWCGLTLFLAGVGADSAPGGFSILVRKRFGVGI